MSILPVVVLLVMMHVRERVHENPHGVWKSQLHEYFSLSLSEFSPTVFFQTNEKGKRTCGEEEKTYLACSLSL